MKKYTKHPERFRVKDKSQYHFARCGHWTINRWNCPTCLERIDKVFDLSMIMELGVGRRAGRGLESN